MRRIYPVSKLSDLGSGHSCFSPHKIISNVSPNVIINGVGCATVGSILEIHSCSDSSHPGFIISGNNSVKINGKSVAHIGSKVNCGSVLITGSSNVVTGIGQASTRESEIFQRISIRAGTTYLTASEKQKILDVYSEMKELALNENSPISDISQFDLEFDEFFVELVNSGKLEVL